MNEIVEKPVPARQLTPEDKIAVFEAGLVEHKDKIVRNLPQTVKPEKFIGAASIAVRKNPTLLELDQSSLWNAISECARDGLVPDHREAVLLPYWDDATKRKIVRYSPMVAGIQKRLFELGDIDQINARAVYKNDRYEMLLGTEERIIHMPALGDRGPIIGAYAIFKKGGRLIHIEWMPTEDLDKVKNAAKTKAVWNAWPEEMTRKSVIRRGAKYVPLSHEAMEIVTRDDTMVNLERLTDTTPPVADNPLIDVKPIDTALPEYEGREAEWVTWFTEQVAACQSKPDLLRFFQSIGAEFMAKMKDEDRAVCAEVYKARLTAMKVTQPESKPDAAEPLPSNAEGLPDGY